MTDKQTPARHDGSWSPGWIRAKIIATRPDGGTDTIELSDLRSIKVRAESQTVESTTLEDLPVRTFKTETTGVTVTLVGTKLKYTDGFRPKEGEAQGGFERSAGRRSLTKGKPTS